MHCLYPLRFHQSFFIFIWRFYPHLQFCQLFSLLFLLYVFITLPVFMGAFPEPYQTQWLIFHLGSFAGLCSEERRLAPLWPGCDFWTSRACALFQDFTVLSRSQASDLAQPVTASIRGQCALDRRREFVQKVISEKSHLEVPIWMESIILNSFNRLIKRT